MRSLISFTAAAALLVIAAPAWAQNPPLEPLGTQLHLAGQGPAGAPAFDVSQPDIAYNSERDEFLAVWSGQDERWPGEIGIYGRRLDGSGRPIGEVLRLSALAAVTPDPDDPVPPATHPSVAYDPDHDRYAVVYAYENISGAYIAFQLVSGDGRRRRFIEALGAPFAVEEPPLPSVVDRKYEPDIAYNTGEETYLVVWRAALGQPGAAARNEVFGLALTADGDPAGSKDGSPIPLSRACARGAGGVACGQAFQPAVVAQNGRSAYIVVWVQAAGLGEPGTIMGIHFQKDEAGLFPPSLLAGTRAGEPMLSDAGDRALLTHTELPVGGAPEVHATVLQSVPNYVTAGGPQARLNAVSTAGVGAARSSVAYMAVHNAYLVVWNGTDDGTAAVAKSEREVTGQVVDYDGREVGRDDFLVSDMGAPGSRTAGTGADRPVIAANPRTGEWIVAWAGEEDRAPYFPGKLELWGRRVGPNTDRDFDGTAVPADCDDLDPAVHPGARDIPVNGIDEDCSGVDNRDRDGDGVEPPLDCDDTDRFIYPKRREVPGNGKDEDCDGRDVLLRTRARVRAVWLFGRQSTTAARLVVEGVRSGMHVRLTCRGSGCAVRTRHLTVTRRGTLRLTRLLAGARLSPGTVVEVRVRDRRAIGVAERFVVRRGAPPRRTVRCVARRGYRIVRCPK